GPALGLRSLSEAGRAALGVAGRVSLQAPDTLVIIPDYTGADISSKHKGERSRKSREYFSEKSRLLPIRGPPRPPRFPVQVVAFPSKEVPYHPEPRQVFLPALLRSGCDSNGHAGRDRRARIVASPSLFNTCRLKARARPGGRVEGLAGIPGALPDSSAG